VPGFGASIGGFGCSPSGFFGDPPGFTPGAVVGVPRLSPGFSVGFAPGRLGCVGRFEGSVGRRAGSALGFAGDPVGFSGEISGFVGFAGACEGLGEGAGLGESGFGESGFGEPGLGEAGFGESATARSSWIELAPAQPDAARATAAASDDRSSPEVRDLERRIGWVTQSSGSLESLPTGWNERRGA
jgi:hypothetical protein